MLLNRWRVGSLSMGLVLLTLGITMLVSFFTRVNIFHAVLTLWPVVLICLGAEIFLHLFFRRGEADIPIKYDMLGILFIGSILTVSVFFYALTFSIELLGAGDNMSAALGIKMEDAYFESESDLPGVDELVVFGGFQNVTVVSAEGEYIRMSYRVSANTNDREYAKSVLESVVKFEPGRRAYVMADSSLYYNNRRVSYPYIHCVIYLPGGKTVDLSQFSGNFQYDSAIEGQIVRLDAPNS